MAKISTKNIAVSIYEATDGKSGATLDVAIKNIVNFLNNKNLLSQSPQILAELERIIDKKDGRVKMKVTSASDVGSEKKLALEDKIKTKYKAKEVVSEYLEDKNVLGGMKIEVGEDMMDYTYRNKLNQLEKHLIQ